MKRVIRDSAKEDSAPVSAAAVAERIERDILAGGFTHGDRFMTVREVARRCEASARTAYLGMRELAERKLLEFRHGSGTFVGPAAGHLKRGIRTVQLVIGPVGSLRGERLLVEGELEGLINGLSGASVHVICLPQKDTEAFLRDLVRRNESDPSVMGVVLIRVARAVRLFFSERKLPAVVIGHCEAGVELPQVDIDQRRLGREVARAMLDRAYRPLGLFMRERWYPGDDLLLAGIQEVLSQRSVPADHLYVHSLPAETILEKGLIRKLLSGPAHPRALICRTESAALASLAVTEELGLNVPADVAVVSVASTDFSIGRATPAVSGILCKGWELGNGAADLLQRFIDGEPAERLRVEIPTELLMRGST